MGSAEGALEQAIEDGFRHTVSGNDERLYFVTLLEAMGLGKRLEDKDASLAEVFKPVIFLLDGVREDKALRQYAESQGITLSSDEAVLRFITDPKRGIPRHIDEKLMAATLHHTDDPLLFYKMGLSAFRHWKDFPVYAKLLRSPGLVLASTKDFNDQLNTILKIRELAKGSGSSLQESRYQVDHSIFEEQFSAAAIAGGCYRVLLGFDKERYILNHAATHSSAKLERIVDEVNRYFNAGLGAIRRDGHEIYLADSEEPFGVVVQLLERTPEKTLVRSGHKMTVQQLELMLKPIEGIDYTSLNGNVGDVDQKATAVLCLRDVAVRGVRFLRQGQFYEAPATLDHFYYQPHGVWGVIKHIFSLFKGTGDITAELAELNQRMSTQAHETAAMFADRLAAERQKHAAERQYLETRSQLEAQLAAFNTLYGTLQFHAYTAHDIKAIARRHIQVETEALARLIQDHGSNEIVVDMERFAVSFPDYVSERANALSGGEVPEPVREGAARLVSHFRVFELADRIMGTKEEQLETKAVEYKSLLDRVITNVRYVIGKPGEQPVSIVNNVQEGLYVHVNQESYESAFINLIKNAAEASPNGTITIDAYPLMDTLQGANGGATYQIKTELTQSGLLPDEIARHLSAGERVQTTKQGGHGLGTQASYNAIRANQGSLRYDSLGNRGGKITILMKGSIADTYQQKTSLDNLADGFQV